MSISKLQAARAALDDAITDVKKQGIKAGVEYFAPLFEKYPELKSFSWEQYTPYFDDGDTCTFGVHDVSQINGVDEYGEDDEGTTWDTLVSSGWGKDEDKGPLYPAYEEAQEYLNKLGDEACEALFGDHVRVVVYPDKIETEEVSHD